MSHGLTTTLLTLTANVQWPKVRHHSPPQGGLSPWGAPDPRESPRLQELCSEEQRLRMAAPGAPSHPGTVWPVTNHGHVPHGLRTCFLPLHRQRHRADRTGVAHRGVFLGTRLEGKIWWDLAKALVGALAGAPVKSILITIKWYFSVLRTVYVKWPTNRLENSHPSQRGKILAPLVFILLLQTDMAIRQVGFQPVEPGQTDHKHHNTHLKKTQAVKVSFSMSRTQKLYECSWLKYLFKNKNTFWQIYTWPLLLFFLFV